MTNNQLEIYSATFAKLNNLTFDASHMFHADGCLVYISGYCVNNLLQGNPKRRCERLLLPFCIIANKTKIRSKLISVCLL